MENTARCLRETLYAVMSQGIATGLDTTNLLDCLADVTITFLHMRAVESCPTGGDVEELLASYDVALRHGTWARMRALDVDDVHDHA